jgi:hypothetical protein
MKHLHRDQTVELGLVGAIHRTEAARADLVKDPKRSEGVGRRSANSVGVQCGYSSGGKAL